MCLKMRAKGPNTELNQSAKSGTMPIGPAHVRRTALILASVLGVNLSPAFASDQNWSQSGEFKLTGKVATEIVWSQSKTTWVSSAAFEKSRAGFDRSARAITFTLSGGSQLDRLLSLISSVESPRGQYNAVHYKATISPPALPTKRIHIPTNSQK